jgi:hypothetical protein
VTEGERSVKSVKYQIVNIVNIWCLNESVTQTQQLEVSFVIRSRLVTYHDPSMSIHVSFPINFKTPV